jgi:hypothetical protein
VPIKDLINNQTEYLSMKRGLLVSSMVDVGYEQLKTTNREYKGFEGGVVLRSTASKFRKQTETSYDFHKINKNKSILGMIKKPQ